MDERETIQAAVGGDRAAFDALAAPLMGPLKSFILRMVTHPADADDILQDTLLKAHQGLAGFRGDAAFKTWIFSIASRASIDHLRRRKRWRVETQLDVQQASYRSRELIEKSTAVHALPDFVYSVREHIAFCFSCIARVLPPEEQAAIMLREVFEFSNLEAAGMLGVTESVFRHKLSDARKVMIDAFENLCSLINKQGVCHQCLEIRGRTAPEKRGDMVTRIGPPGGDPEQSFDARLAIVSSADLAGGQSHKWHELIFAFMTEVEDSREPAPTA